MGKGLTIHDHDHTSAGFTQQEVLAEVIEKCSKSEDIKPRKKDSMFRLVNAMWPAKILLDPRIKDESTWKFNLLERVFFAFSMLVKGFMSDGKIIGASDTMPSQNMGKAWPSMQALQSLHPRQGQSSSQGAGLNLSTS